MLDGAGCLCGTYVVHSAGVVRYAMLVELREVAQFGQRAAFGTLRPGVQIPPSRLVKSPVSVNMGFFGYKGGSALHTIHIGVVL